MAEPTTDELRSFDLLDEYIHAWHGGQPISVETLLARCPESERQSLSEAIEGANMIIEHYAASYVRPQVLDRTLEAVHKIQAERRAKALNPSSAQEGQDG